MVFFPLKDENPTERKPILTVTLIGMNVGIFILTYFSGNFAQIIRNYGLVPARIAEFEGLRTVFTSMFLHGGFFHVISNVWYLWIFGDNIEDLFGRSKFLLIYFGSGVAATLAHVAFNPSSTVPTIGASGAVAGILGAYIIKYPRAKVLTLLFIFLFIQIVKVPSLIFLGIWIGLQVINASITTVAGTQVSVAYWAHIGGFAAGMLMAFLSRGNVSSPRRKITEEFFRTG